MTRLPVTFSPEADRDLEHIEDYLSDRNPDAALSFLENVKESVERIAVLPEIGVIQFPDDPQLAAVRMLVFPARSFRKYLILYELLEERVYVLRIIHGAQNIEHIL